MAGALDHRISTPVGVEDADDSVFVAACQTIAFEVPSQIMQARCNEPHQFKGTLDIRDAYGSAACRARCDAHSIGTPRKCRRTRENARLNAGGSGKDSHCLVGL